MVELRIASDIAAADDPQPANYDPVCGGAIVDERTAPIIAYAGHVHWFCSDECRALFVDEPERFLVIEDLGQALASVRSDGEAGVLRDV